MPPKALSHRNLNTATNRPSHGSKILVHPHSQGRRFIQHIAPCGDPALSFHFLSPTSPKNNANFSKSLHRSLPFQNGFIKQNQHETDICTIPLQWICHSRHLGTTGSITPSATAGTSLPARLGGEPTLYQHRNSTNTHWPTATSPLIPLQGNWTHCTTLMAYHHLGILK